MERTICPDCGRQLRKTWRNGPDQGDYTIVWHCDYYAAHGVPVACANECGEPVRNPREHWHFVDGVIGSGRWSCIPERQISRFRDSIRESFDQ